MAQSRSKSRKKKGSSPRKPITTARLIRLRYVLVATAMVAIAARIAYCAFHTTVLDRDIWNDKANKELQQVEEILPIRGDILACDGSVLATNLTFYNTCIDFKASQFSADSLKKYMRPLCDSLAKYHSFHNSREWREILTRENNRVDSNRNSAFPFLYNLSYSELERLRSFPFFNLSKNKNVNGLTETHRIKRKHPYGAMALRSIGGVGDNGHGKIVGKSGLEAALDSWLYGKPGRSKKVPLTRRIENWTDIPARNGYTLTTTIDINMQDVVENALNEMLRESRAAWGTAILMKVDDGDIKAISNLERDSAGNYIEAMNYAMMRMEPGSVTKAISMVIALEDGFITDPNAMYETPAGGYFYGSTQKGTEIKDTHSPASLPVCQFLRYSSNIGVTKLVAPHFEKDPNSFRERIRQMGFLDTLGTGIYGERPPYFPDLDLRRGGKMTLARQTYGYCMMIPPMYTLAFYNALANNGDFVRPRLLRRIQGNGLDSLMPVTHLNKRICSPENAAIMRRWLKEVIYEKGGTAPTVKNPYVEAAGKTGTAKIATEKARDGKNDPNFRSSYNSSRYRYAFCGFFPYDKPEYTCMVVVADTPPDNTRYRSPANTSAIVFRNIMLRMYSRGMLETENKHEAIERVGGNPIVYGSVSANDSRDELSSMLGTANMSHLRTRAKVSGGIPDVRGQSVRQAVRTLEKAGYNVSVSGSGYVTAMTPEAGTKARRGTRVRLSLSSWRSGRMGPAKKKDAPAATTTAAKPDKSAASDSAGKSKKKETAAKPAGSGEKDKKKNKNA
ncbi:MAG: penicillin-binding transpeptidase domain-containing protein [Muribaculaceae bacterium]|nr:penicillin-binding transpeptidase domain-containing protein [Muribaculaceae bacterium]